MGCSTSQSAKVVSAATKENGINEQTEADRKYPPAEAFVVPLDDEADSIIKKHPPKRLQRLVDTPATETTIEELEEKLANAELRRNQFLSDRVNTLKSKDDENIESTVPDTDNEKILDIKNSETPTADRDTNSVVPAATNEGNVNNSSSNEAQENH
ncbi:uncharacterized protein LOC119086057 [Bradysia coprophila]|uniref:uncharacterized protein LOC119086057 n=1 Tax=Bradysia coprophila TaxID=38358 RepID=UPI00187DD62F|nr:uncharacterized protein LOC119086057 [Bradysia coprophila]